MRVSILLASAFAALSMAKPLEKRDALDVNEAATPVLEPPHMKRATKSKKAAKPTSTTYQQAVVRHHNYHRSNHSSPAIKWSASLAKTAMSIAQNCVYAHNMTASKTAYGQNIAAGYDAGMISNTISDLFYNNEVNNFDYYGEADPDMTNFGSWGHFSQIVWADTTAVGCATWECPSLTNIPSGSGIAPILTVCNYSPPGNVGGEYGDNIGASKGKATITGSHLVNEKKVLSSYNTATGQSET